ncbi:MC153 [Molluscum contagiosum virus subtype 2]|uniref:MC153 n=2 Tax=Molluscum contagiosum virus TaxID=10279 RepID=A0A1S7DLX9_MCV2|nr:MC153 [Molluscum contagiosum virus subtype 2]QHW16544.1 MC153R [Molluscum contagiosum virus]AYO87788.1 MC153 [Molluscum contagiosum virus subtype 2]AYO87958.1 MC153 [Molluscum contagiosum virus subtype 2]AYO88128.1 MC153 [Molluscum contagiosum virus subtype 2]
MPLGSKGMEPLTYRCFERLPFCALAQLRCLEQRVSYERQQPARAGVCREHRMAVGSAACGLVPLPSVLHVDRFVQLCLHSYGSVARSSRFATFSTLRHGDCVSRRAASAFSRDADSLLCVVMVCFENPEPAGHIGICVNTPRQDTRVYPLSGTVIACSATVAVTVSGGSALKLATLYYSISSRMYLLAPLEEAAGVVYVHSAILSRNACIFDNLLSPRVCFCIARYQRVDTDARADANGRADARADAGADAGARASARAETNTYYRVFVDGEVYDLELGAALANQRLALDDCECCESELRAPARQGEHSELLDSQCAFRGYAEHSEALLFHFPGARTAVLTRLARAEPSPVGEIFLQFPVPRVPLQANASLRDLSDIVRVASDTLVDTTAACAGDSYAVSVRSGVRCLYSMRFLFGVITRLEWEN